MRTDSPFPRPSWTSVAGTTDFVVVKDQGVIHGSSGSLQCGMLDVKQQVANGDPGTFRSGDPGEQLVTRAVENRSCGCMVKTTTSHPWSKSAKQQVVERIHAKPAGSWVSASSSIASCSSVGNGGPGRGYRQLVSRTRSSPSILPSPTPAAC